MFCGNCGQKLPDDARFCGNCGSPVIQAAPQANTAVKAPQSVPQSAPATQPQTDASGKRVIFPDPNVTAVTPQNAAAVRYRVKCPDCGKIQDASYTYTCPGCGRQHTVDIANNGFLYLYRMGHISGSAMGQEIYLNGESYGLLANANGVLVVLAPGAYNLHCAITSVRNCDDMIINIQPGRTVYAKAQLQVGFIKGKIHLFQAQPSEMPPLK